MVHVTQLKTKDAIPITTGQYRYITLGKPYFMQFLFTIYLFSYGIVLTNRTIQTSKIVTDRKYDIMKECNLFGRIFFILNDIKDEIKHK